MARPLRIAIVGGSISGCTLASGLLGLNHIQFDLFESKDSFQERGAAIAMHTNALGALRIVGIDADRILKDGGANKRDFLQTIVGCGENQGKEFLETIEGPWGIGRQQLLEQLVKTLPEERLHTGKKLTHITEAPSNSTDPLVLHFSDHTTHTADAIIGCDGYRSEIRKIILGPDNPACNPVFAGFWDARGLLPTTQAVTNFGTNLIDPRKPELSACVGNGCFTLSGQIGAGQMYFVTTSGVAPPNWDKSAWKVGMDRKHLERTYEGWDQKFKQGAIDCVENNGPGVVFNQWESQPCERYWRGKICMMGDAAHATSNWLGQGAAMAMEDCAVLVKLFEQVRTPEDVETAFSAFDHVRRNGRPHMVIEQSRLLGQILTGQFGLDPKEVKRFDIQKKREEIRKYDVNLEVEKAVKCFEGLKKQ